MKLAIKKHWRDFAAIIGLVVIALVVGGYVLANQRISFPTWVPVLGRDEYILKGEFQTAQAVTPGQGQTVDIAGVQVGEISSVSLKDGRAIVTMRMDPRYDKVYSNATMLLRPKTGLKDMVVELDPGSPSDGARRIPSGGTLPVSQTQPDVNLDEILASLDGDTRSYLQLLLQGAAIGLSGNGEQLAQAFRRFDPLAADARKATKLLISRHRNIKRAVTNFGKFAQALSRNDQQLAGFVDSSQAALRRFADQGDNIEAMLRELPGTLTEAQGALRSTRAFADELGPTLNALEPFARNLGPALTATRPFLTETTPIIRDQIRPFTVAATPVVQTLRPAARALAAATPNLVKGFSIFNEFFNALAYNPPGRAESYLFYLDWLGHTANSALATQDAMGSMLRAVLADNCGNGIGINGVKAGTGAPSAALTLATQMSNIPDTSSPFCRRGGG